jgi:hypothetical protein
MQKEVYPEYTVYKIKMGTNTRVFNISNTIEDQESYIEQLMTQEEDLPNNNLEDGDIDN